MRSSKKIWITVICVVIAAAVIWLLDFLLYPCTFVRNNIHTITTEQKDVLIFGTSHGMSDIDPENLLSDTGLSGQNCCVGGEYPIDIYYMTKLAIEKQSPKKMIFQLDPGYFTTEKEKGNNYLLFYHEFPLSGSKWEYFWAAMKDCDFRSPLFAFHEYSLELEISKIPETVYQKWNNNYDVSYLKGEKQEYHENGFVEKYPVAMDDFPGFSPVLFSEADVVETNMKYLTEIIRLCREKNIEFTAVSLPLPDAILANYGDSYEEAWDYFSEFFKEQGAEFINFNREYYDSFGHEITNYVDFDGHMNGDSARAFSTVFGNILFD